jgi:hypothetical protein
VPRRCGRAAPGRAGTGTTGLVAAAIAVASPLIAAVRG